MKRKVLFIIHLPPPVHGASLIGKYIEESNYINNHYVCNFINLSTSRSLSEIGKSSLKKFVIYLKINLLVLYNLLFTKFDLYYMTLTSKSFGFYKDLIIVTWLKIFNKKIIYHFNNKGVSLYSNRKLDNLLYKFAFKNTTSIITSEFIYNDIKKYVPEENVFFCPNGIPNTGELVSRNSKVIKLLFLSNIMKEKGVFDLLETCKILKERNYKFHCNFVGGWSDITEEMLSSKIISMGLSDFVTYHGPKYEKEKEDFLIQSDIFVFPTYYHVECFPLVLLEAMQYQLPIVSTAEAAIPEIVSDGITGFIAEKRNIKDLADKISRLIDDDKLRETMGKAGKEKFLKNYTLEVFERNFTRIVDYLIDKK